MPLTWRQVTARLSPARFTIHTSLKQIEKTGDPLAALLTSAVEIEPMLDQLMRRLESEV